MALSVGILVGEAK